MLKLFLISSLLALAQPCEDTCTHSVDESAVTTAEVVADMKETLDKSKKFLNTVETKLRDFVIELETKMTVDSRQLERAQLLHTRRETCALEKAFEKKLAAKTEEFCASNVTKEMCTCEEKATGTSPSPSTHLDDLKILRPSSKIQKIAVSWPSNACAQLIHSNNSTLFVNITGYPYNVAEELDLSNTPRLQYFDDEAKGVIVRKGCMATMWSHSHNDRCEEMRDLSNIEHGEYELKTFSTGTVDTGARVNGLSTVHCMCDPLRTNPNAKQARKDCTQEHAWNEKTKRCEFHERPSQHVCGVITNSEGEKMDLNIPNWPLNKRYDVHLGQARLENFHKKVASITVRNGCFASMYTGDWLDAPKSLETVGYGVHAALGDTSRVICQCMNDDSKNEEFAVDNNPWMPACVENHEYSEETKRCEWNAQADACAELTNFKGAKRFVTAQGVYGELDLTAHPDPDSGEESDADLAWDHTTVRASVRQGCMATFWSMSDQVEIGSLEGNKDAERTLLSNVEYGAYEIEEIDMGTAAGGHSSSGLIKATCFCDPTRKTITPPSRHHAECLPNHVYDEITGVCEWALAKNICGEIENHDGKRMLLKIPNWPRNKRYAVNLIHANITAFARKVTSISVRQHCFASIYDGTHLRSNNILPVQSYGKYKIGSFYNGTAEKEEEGAQRIICECMY